ncbi:pyridoxamine 5'-phosphate oxidase [Rhodococcus sp. NPDC055112]
MSPDSEPESAANPDLAAMRVGYAHQDPNPAVPEGNLGAESLRGGWYPLLRRWLDQARSSGIAEPNAMVLATVDAAGRPASRTVLCKGLSEDGLVFYTNYGSNKARELAGFPYASATFSWIAFAHQVTVRGSVSRVDPGVTEKYWHTRPRGSQLGAWASNQSSPIDSRVALEAQLAEVTARFADVDDVPVPPNWGGFLLRPDSVEFWQGRANRMHNRVKTALTDGVWTAERLQP